MRDQPIDVGLGDIVRRERFGHERPQRVDRDLVDLVALHAHARRALAHEFEAARDAVRIQEQILVAAIRMQMGAQDARDRVGFEDHGARPVREQHAGRAVLPIDDARERLGADHECALRFAQAHELVGNAERIEKAGARRLQAERRAAVDAESLLQQRADVGKHEIRRRRADADQIHVLGADAGVGHRAAGGMFGEIAGRLTVGRDMALLDAGTGAYPLVGGLDDSLEIRVGQDFFRQVAARPGNA